MIKRYIYIVIAAGLTLAASSCKKALDQPVLGNYEASSYFTSIANANAAVNAAYVPLTFISGTDNPIWVLGDVASDDEL